MSNLRHVEAPTTLLPFLFATWPETKKKQVREWLKFGSVAVNDRTVTQFDHPLKRGDRVTLHRRGMAAPETKIPGGIRIRHEDADILVIEKPAGLLSIASASEADRTAYALLTQHVRRGNPRGRERVWIVHRLDRETSGVMVFAKSESAKTALQKNWDAAEKRYFAVVEGAPPQESGTLESWLDESNPLKVYVGGNGPQMRHAITHYRVMKKGKGVTLLEVTLETGRRHQIRAQLAQAGCPIVGDGKYGAETDPIKRVALHACSLRFTHPTARKPMRFESPLPGEMGKLV
ncbi:MAG TPA: RluA family pseudouridine synthase [Candidatus Methylacidiphilales bacterium]|jgi:23S rRNA pseudouridine1911/1915/1917 synthase|nr:RluA family pseudouridine synthase [Candidatus Methylacidiphilales bacterium]